MQLPMGASSQPSSTKSADQTTTANISAASSPIPFPAVPVMPALPAFAQVPFVEETPGPEKDLVQAMRLVAQAVTSRIAYHESQINALRRALEPFGNLAKHGMKADASEDDALTELLAIAGKLKEK